MPSSPVVSQRAPRTPSQSPSRRQPSFPKLPSLLRPPSFGKAISFPKRTPQPSAEEPSAGVVRGVQVTPAQGETDRAEDALFSKMELELQIEAARARSRVHRLQDPESAEQSEFMSRRALHEEVMKLRKQVAESEGQVRAAEQPKLPPPPPRRNSGLQPTPQPKHHEPKPPPKHMALWQRRVSGDGAAAEGEVTCPEAKAKAMAEDGEAFERKHGRFSCSPVLPLAHFPAPPDTDHCSNYLHSTDHCRHGALNEAFAHTASLDTLSAESLSYESCGFTLPESVSPTGGATAGYATGTGVTRPDGVTRALPEETGTLPRGDRYLGRALPEETGTHSGVQAFARDLAEVHTRRWDTCSPGGSPDGGPAAAAAPLGLALPSTLSSPWSSPPCRQRTLPKPRRDDHLGAREQLEAPTPPMARRPAPPTPLLGLIGILALLLYLVSSLLALVLLGSTYTMPYVPLVPDALSTAQRETLFAPCGRIRVPGLLDWRICPMRKH